MLTHLFALIGQFLLPTVGPIIGPLIVWIIKKDTMPFVNDQGKEAINFNISVLIYALISGLLTFFLIGFVMLAILGIFWLIFTIVAVVKAHDGVAYRYPLTIRFLR
ncbi:MAG: DUF4870 domain-containing protein [Verrucomicrobia bacterium]|nr:MAG: DUF4870 domain-containing protein [Verrucomicrobiota bacterium]